jgi:hypothetical protein
MGGEKIVNYQYHVAQRSQNGNRFDPKKERQMFENMLRNRLVNYLHILQIK